MSVLALQQRNLPKRIHVIDRRAIRKLLNPFLRSLFFSKSTGGAISGAEKRDRFCVDEGGVIRGMVEGIWELTPMTDIVIHVKLK